MLKPSRGGARPRRWLWRRARLFCLFRSFREVPIDNIGQPHQIRTDGVSPWFENPVPTSHIYPEQASVTRYKWPAAIAAVAGARIGNTDVAWRIFGFSHQLRYPAGETLKLEFLRLVVVRSNAKTHV